MVEIVINNENKRTDCKESNIVEMFRLNPQVKALTIDCVDRGILKAASAYLTSLKSLIISTDALNLPNFYEDLSPIHFKTVKKFGFALVSHENVISDLFRDHGLPWISFDHLVLFKFICNRNMLNEQAVLDGI